MSTFQIDAGPSDIDIHALRQKLARFMKDEGIVFPAGIPEALERMRTASSQKDLNDAHHELDLVRMHHPELSEGRERSDGLPPATTASYCLDALICIEADFDEDAQALYNDAVKYLPLQAG